MKGSIVLKTSTTMKTSAPKERKPRKKKTARRKRKKTTSACAMSDGRLLEVRATPCSAATSRLGVGDVEARGVCRVDALAPASGA